MPYDERAAPPMPEPETYEQRIARILGELGIPENFGRGERLPRWPEAAELVPVGKDLYGRDQRLAPHAAACWESMNTAAREEGITLLLVSGFRSVDYQRGIWERKFAKGQTVDQILEVSAPPGYSQHHTGLALDLTTPGVPDLTEEFENTDAFRWLERRAAGFGFVMSYPRGNPYGLSYEPWHWFAPQPA